MTRPTDRQAWRSARESVARQYGIRRFPNGCEICDGDGVVGGSHGVPAHPCSHCHPNEYRNWQGMSPASPLKQGEGE